MFLVMDSLMHLAERHHTEGFSVAESFCHTFPIHPADLIESVGLEHMQPVDCPLEHSFTGDQYCRRITMPTGALITSRIHNTRHHFMILKGMVSVWDEEGGEVILRAGHVGITEPGTRRMLFIHEECVWVTVHNCAPGETVEDIEVRILAPHVNPLNGIDHYAMSRMNPSFNAGPRLGEGSSL
jgi:mannose-6-phosphate isomerase-like protein (cupin superfamily)